MEKIKIGVQMFTLRGLMKKAADVRCVFEKVADMGAETVQLSHMCEIDARELAAISRDTKLPICVTHSPVLRIKNDLDKLAEEHLTYGCKHIGIGMMPKEYRVSNDGFLKFLELLNVTAAKLKPYGMDIAYHNHNFEFKEIGGGMMLDRLIAETVPEVQFIPDTFWIKVGGFEPQEYIKKMNGRVSTLHLKDYKKGIVPVFKALGDGRLDFKAVMKTAEDIGVENAVFELDFALNPLKAVDKSLKYMKTIY
jgi:Sugar phosphate isomerases/epimerases